MIHINKGKVYGGAINNKRKRYAKDLKTKRAHDKKGDVVVDPNTGVPAELKNTELSFRAGYNKACAENTAAAKTSVGLRSDEKVPDGFKIKNVLFQEKTGTVIATGELAKAFNAPGKTKK